MENKEKTVKRKFTMKQEKFCNEYIKDFNLTQAAIRAGYSERSACLIASENIRKPYIQQRVSQIAIKTLEKVGLNAEIITDQLKKIAFADINDFMKYDPATKSLDWKPLNEIDGTLVQDVVTVESEGGVKKTYYRLKDSMKAFDMLCKILKLYLNHGDTNVNNNLILIVPSFNDALVIDDEVLRKQITKQEPKQITEGEEKKNG